MKTPVTKILIVILLITCFNCEGDKSIQEHLFYDILDEMASSIIVDGSKNVPISPEEYEKTGRFELQNLSDSLKKIKIYIKQENFELTDTETKDGIITNYLSSTLTDLKQVSYLPDNSKNITKDDFSVHFILNYENFKLQTSKGDGSSVFLNLSKMVTNEQRNLSVIYAYVTKSKLDSLAYIIFLKFLDGKWKIVKVQSHGGIA